MLPPANLGQRGGGVTNSCHAPIRLPKRIPARSPGSPRRAHPTPPTSVACRMCAMPASGAHQARRRASERSFRARVSRPRTRSAGRPGARRGLHHRGGIRAACAVRVAVSKIALALPASPPQRRTRSSQRTSPPAQRRRHSRSRSPWRPATEPASDASSPSRGRGRGDFRRHLGRRSESPWVKPHLRDALSRRQAGSSTTWTHH